MKNYELRSRLLYTKLSVEFGKVRFDGSESDWNIVHALDGCYIELANMGKI